MPNVGTSESTNVFRGTWLRISQTDTLRLFVTIANLDRKFWFQEVDIRIVCEPGSGNRHVWKARLICSKFSVAD